MAAHSPAPEPRDRRTLVIIGVATLGGFVLWLAILYLIWQGLRAAGGRTDFWIMADVLSTALATAALFGAGYVAYRELNELDRSRYIDVADRIFAELNSPDNIEARRWIFQHLPADPAAWLTEQDETGQAHVKRVLNSLDRVAFLTQPGWIPDDMIMPWVHPMIYKSWVRLEAYVDFESARRKEDDYYYAARQLAQRCAKWRADHDISPDVIWVPDAF